MTTICFKSGILAFDSKISGGGVAFGTGIKGVKTNKFLLAAAGSCEDCDAWLDWMKATGGDLDTKKNYGLDKECEMECIAIDKKGRVRWYGDKCYPYTIDGHFHALGSGYAFAMGAMAFGASAAQAVRIAAKFDTATGGTVRELKW